MILAVDVRHNLQFVLFDLLCIDTLDGHTPIGWRAHGRGTRCRVIRGRARPRRLQ